MISLIISSLALAFSIYQFLFSLWMSRTNYKISLLLASVTKEGLLLKVVIINRSSRPLIINSFDMIYEDDKSMAIHSVSPFNFEIARGNFTDCVPINVKGYSTKTAYFFMSLNSPLPHNWLLFDKAYSFYIICNSNKKSKIDLPIAEKIVKFEGLKKTEGTSLSS